MKFSQVAGTAIVPTLARLVLGFAFITVGFNKLTTNATFDAKQAEILTQYGVTVTPVAAAAFVDGERIIHLAQSRKPLSRPASTPDPTPETKPAAPPEPEPEPEAAEDEPKPAAPAAETKPASSPDDAPESPDTADTSAEDDGPRGIPAEDLEDAAAEVVDPAEPADAPVLEGVFEARAMHKITVLCHTAGWPRANWMALLASITEFVGGILLVVGLFSRIWALGLSVAMGVAFYLVSMRINLVHETNPFHFAQDIGKFNTLFSQAGLFTLAMGVLLTGPGPLSLDRMLFRKSKTADELEEGVIIYDDPAQ